jgi:hypothetical protein
MPLEKIQQPQSAAGYFSSITLSTCSSQHSLSAVKSSIVVSPPIIVISINSKLDLINNKLIHFIISYDFYLGQHP